jgi:hypothetical protein
MICAKTSSVVVRLPPLRLAEDAARFTPEATVRLALDEDAATGRLRVLCRWRVEVVLPDPVSQSLSLWQFYGPVKLFFS